MIKLTLLLGTIILWVASTASGATLGGSVYVPNLHAKCLSAHQKRLLECAINVEESITEKNIICAQESIKEYNTCEQILNKLRDLDRIAPIELQSYENRGKKILKQLEALQYEGYPD